MESNIRALVLLNLLNSLRNSFIKLIKHEHSCEILYLKHMYNQARYKPPERSSYKNDFSYFSTKTRCAWLLKRTFSMKWFFWAQNAQACMSG